MLGSVALLAVAAGPALAADLGTPPMQFKAAQQVYDWTGFYVGGHFSYTWTHTDSQTTNTANGQLFAPTSGDTSYPHGGGQFGFDYMTASRVVLGIVAEFTSGRDQTTTTANRFVTVQNESDVKVNGNVRGRLGYAFDNLLLYGTAGWAWQVASNSRTQIAGTVGNATPGTAETTTTGFDNGWVVGAGVDYAFAPNWDLFVEYKYLGVPDHTVTFPIAELSSKNSSSTNGIEVGLNWRFNGPGRAAY
ncbi:MAG TPA: outer membrane beta-barrel protein [Xanthobacteraceae bacterium]